MSSFTLQQLTEGIRQRHVGTQNKRLVEKWARTGLLRGLEEVNRENMATLLENQASQLLREANTIGSGDIKGFTSIAFPIVRRVFGGLVANELVSIQPMSLPSGLLFYLDYTYGSDVGGSSDTNATYASGSSIYNNPVGKGIQSGSLATGGQYDLVGSGFSKLHNTASFAADADHMYVLTAAGLIKDPDGGTTKTAIALDVTNPTHLKLIQFDQQIIDRITPVASGGLGESWVVIAAPLSGSTGPHFANLDTTMIKDFSVHTQANLSVVPAEIQSGASKVVRRLNQLGNVSSAATGGVFTANPFAVASDATAVILMVAKLAASTFPTTANAIGFSYVVNDTLTIGTAVPETVVTPGFESDLGGNGFSQGGITPVIPEIDIKIESIPVTTSTRKLRARWSPELAQDLNAYHSLDAEVELTQILSEQIALEIDREILNDLLTGAQGANFFWSRAPGKFVNKRTGAEVARTSTLTPGPAFTGTVREWYETLIETIIDVANEIHRKTLRGSANFIVVSPDVATVLEASVLYRPAYSIDGDGQVASPFTMGAEKIGTLSNRFTVYKDPYFPRNKILVGYKGGSYLETGFVYAPYVPLIVTPTIFAPEDFTPRKGVMTRYGKKMVRADFYGTVTCLDMNII
jgi:hypothetical protein